MAGDASGVCDVGDACDVCGRPGPLVPTLRVNVAGAFAAAVGLCPACGFRRLAPRPSPDRLAACYADDYFAGGGFRDYARQQQRHDREARHLAGRLRRLAPTGRLLEVGCALGFLLEGLRRRCDWEIEGLDLSAFGTRFAAERLGLAVRRATLEEAAFPDASFDFVVQKDLLEHVARPRDHLRETARVLRPGGRLWLVTPNGEANLRPLARLAATRLADRPDRLPLLEQAHVSFFTRANLLRLFDECGFRVLGMRSTGLKRGLRALGRLPARRSPPDGPADPRPTPAPAGGGDFAAFADAMAADLERHRSALRGAAAYAAWRRFQDRLDSAPGRLAWGVDWDCLLERR